jgi:acyl-CoA reductase-like NAD-dependent aldehyde dehydrogenase
MTRRITATTAAWIDAETEMAWAGRPEAGMRIAAAIGIGPHATADDAERAIAAADLDARITIGGWDADDANAILAAMAAAGDDDAEADPE